jgi:Nucleotidyl transferase AbiEii toxin, Type IV TA system
MDSLHERLARLALSAAGDYGFCLAGGYAVQAHGFLDRPSEDVDLFTTSAAEEQFPEALTTVIAAYKGDGLDVSTTAEGPGFARLQVTDPTTRATAKVELGIDWRAHQPVTLAIGPVLHPDDAVANKVCALFSRAQARDYIDVDAVLQSGRYTSNGPPRTFRIATIRVFRPLAVDSGTHCRPPVVFGSPAPSEAAWYCSGTRCTGPHPCGRVPWSGRRFG